MAYCLAMVAVPAKTTRSRQPLPAKRWRWTRPWPIPMPFSAATRCSTTGILPEERLSTKKALELDPNDATAHQWYALDLGFIGGREQEAIAEANRAHELDPLSPII